MYLVSPTIREEVCGLFACGEQPADLFSYKAPPQAAKKHMTVRYFYYIYSRQEKNLALVIKYSLYGC